MKRSNEYREIASGSFLFYHIRIDIGKVIIILQYYLKYLSTSALYNAYALVFI